MLRTSPFQIKLKCHMKWNLKKKKKKSCFHGSISAPSENLVCLLQYQDSLATCMGANKVLFPFLWLFLIHFHIASLLQLLTSRKHKWHPMEKKQGNLFLPPLSPPIIFLLDFLTVYMKAVWGAYDTAKNNPTKKSVYCVLPPSGTILRPWKELTV